MEAIEISQTDNKIAIYTGASLLKIEDAEQTKLLASFDPKEIEIRPDGLIYLPQTFWRKRLNETFGIGQWCLIVKGSHRDPDETKDKLYLQGVLMVRGCYIGEAVGEAELHSKNENQSWASVWESAKSDCITRCCKDLGIASELWQPQFIAKWKKDNAIDVWVTVKYNGQEKDKKQWRKKDAEPFWNEKKATVNAPGTQQQANTAPEIKVPSEVLDAIAKLDNCHTVDELTLFKSTLEKKIVTSSDFKNAALVRYNKILNAEKAKK